MGGKKYTENRIDFAFEKLFHCMYRDKWIGYN